VLQRLLSATALLFCVSGHVRNGSHFASIVPHMIAAGAGTLLLVGLWTPVAGAVIAATELWIVFSAGGNLHISIVLATLGASLAMIGPGAWSVDAHLFGRKHFEIPER
jgi:putative oxidoreductase